MKCLKYLISVACLAVVSTVSADAATYTTQDFGTAVKPEQKKSTISIKEKGGNLVLSGDIRAKWKTFYRKTDGQPGFGPGTGQATNDYEAKTNLVLSYDADDTWAQAKIEFKKCPLGVEDDGIAKVYLRRAFAGIDLYEHGEHEIYMEVGRQQLGDLFESAIQFDAVFDGILTAYQYSWKELFDLKISGGPFVIYNCNNDYGWVAEASLMKLFDTGLYTKLSYIKWSKGQDLPLKFRNWQVVMGYILEPAFMNTPVRLYSGLVINQAAQSNRTSNNRTAREGWYIGTEIGKLEKGGDFLLDINYQWVGFYAVPQFDMSGIGAGFNEAPGDAPLIGGPFQDPKTVQGNTNFRGVSATATYNLTTNFAFRADAAYSTRILKEIGHGSLFKKFELGVVYSF